VEQLALPHVVAELEFLVREQVPVGVQDALGHAGGAGGVVELGRVVGGGVDDVERVGGLLERGGQIHVGAPAAVEHEDHLGKPVRDAVAVGRVRDEHLRLRVAQAMLDALVAVQN